MLAAVTIGFLLGLLFLTMFIASANARAFTALQKEMETNVAVLEKLCDTLVIVMDEAREPRRAAEANR